MTTEHEPVKSELFDATPEAESQPAAESTTTNGEEIEAQESQDSKKVLAEVNRKKQIESFKKKISNGDMTLEEVPHEWIRDALSKEVKPKEALSEEAVTKILEKREAAKRFSDMRERLNELGLSAEKQKKVETLFGSYKAKGLTEADALETAIGLAGIKLEAPDRFAARIPKPSTRKLGVEEEVKAKLEEGEFPNEVPLDKRIDHWEVLRKKSQGMSR